MDGITTGAMAGGNMVPRAGGLGLGLGLNPMQRGRFLQAAQSGPGGGLNYLTSHPQLEQRVQNRIAGGSDRDTALQNFMATGQAPSGASLRYGPRHPAPGGGMFPRGSMRGVGRGMGR